MILIIKDAKGILSLLFCPIFLIGLLISTKMVDYLYHLEKYKTSCFISQGKKKFYFTGYFDTGNTLKYEDIPVIFISQKSFHLKLESKKEIEVQTITGTKNVICYPTLISIEDHKDSFFVYLAISEDVKDFHGCEILLNAYLII